MTNEKFMDIRRRRLRREGKKRRPKRTGTRISTKASKTLGL